MRASKLGNNMEMVLSHCPRACFELCSDSRRTVWKVSKHVPTWEYLTCGPLCLPNNHHFCIMLGLPLHSWQTGENTGRGRRRINSFDGELCIFWREGCIWRCGVSWRGYLWKASGSPGKTGRVLMQRIFLFELLLPLPQWCHGSVLLVIMLPSTKFWTYSAWTQLKTSVKLCLSLRRSCCQNPYCRERLSKGPFILGELGPLSLQDIPGYL